MAEATLFDQVVAATRLNRLVAPFTVSRLLTRANLTPADLTPAALAQVLPEFERGLAVYLDSADLSLALRDLRALAR